MTSPSAIQLRAERRAALLCIRCALPARTIRSERGERTGIHCEDCNAYQVMHVRRCRPLKKITP